MRRNRMADYAVYIVVRVLICVVQALSLEAGQTMAGWLAWLLGDLLGIRRKVVEENLRHAFPEQTDDQRRHLARRMWVHLFLLVLEVAHASRKIHDTNWRKYARIKNVEPLVRVLLTGRPVVLVTAHFGNFELGGFLMGILGFPTYSVARNLDNPYLDQFVGRFRGATGQYLIPKNGGFEQICHVLAHNGTMALLADQYAGTHGCWVEFFGRQASAHKAIALLSMEHDALMAVCCARRRGRPLEFEMELMGTCDPREASDEVGSIRQLTQWYTGRLEAMVRTAPEQYWWLHRRWKDPRPPRKAKKAAA